MARKPNVGALRTAVTKLRQEQRKLERLSREVRQLRGSRNVVFTPEEHQLAERVHEAVPARDTREFDVFLSYARIDGRATADELRRELTARGVTVWFDETAIPLGQSLARHMDRGLAGARAGVVILTPGFLGGRYWTELELGALLHKPTLVPVLHEVEFSDVARYSAFLADRHGLTTENDTIAEIAEKLAAMLDM